LHWFKEVPGIIDFCLFNKGIYSGIPTMWGLPPALLKETKCFFKGDAYCEYHFKWKKDSLKDKLLKLVTPWRALTYTIEELEKDKEILKEKFDEVHHLNIQLKERLDQLLSVQEALIASEAKFRTLIENIPGVAIYGFGPNGIIYYWNKASESLYGYTAAEALGKNLLDLIISPYLKATVAQALESGSQITRWDELLPPGEYLLLHKDGLSIPVYSVHTVVSSEGSSPLIFRADVDLSERKRVEEERLKLDKLESLSILAGGIAHDFNNILTAILGNISLAMLEQQLSPNSLERLAAAEKGCQQAHALSMRLLTFAKGGAPIKRTCSITELLHESVKLALCGSNSQCDFLLPDDLWLVEVDLGQINQVLGNLLINADQAMPAGGLIKIQAENVILGEKIDQSLPKGRYVKISISDQGIGIPQENLSKIFDPYFTTKQKGSGLGLATVYSIIKSHGGEITVASELGVGTRFQIYLPAIEEAMVPVSEEGTLGFLPGQGNVLIMDDDEMVRDMLRIMLQKLGYRASCAENGEEAIRLFKEALDANQPFAAAILDLTIPGGMGGRETIHQLLSMDPKTKVIVSSGYSDDPIMANFKEHGFHGVITKPYRIGELSKTLHGLLE
jgi:two-component system, cell cycle sensor histidine kinase and response regulator CckA